MTARTQRDRNALLSLVVVAAGGLVISTAISHHAYHPFHQDDMYVGLVVALLFHGIGDMLFQRALGRSTTAFLALALGTIFVRLFGLIILTGIVIVWGFLRVEPFLMGLLPAYFLGIGMEIARLASVKGHDAHHEG